jgi:hypothetical protein
VNIREPVGMCKHDAAIFWINALMVDLKLRIVGQEPTAPMTMERLDEFNAHYNDLMRCKVNATTSRYSYRPVPKHDSAADWLNRLVINLKKFLLGFEGDPITLERLAEFREYRAEIESCTMLCEVRY